MSQKALLLVPNKKEAAALLSAYSWVKSQDMYVIESEQLYLKVTGKGAVDAYTHAAEALSVVQPAWSIGLGICGSLGEFRVGEVVQSITHGSANHNEEFVEQHFPLEFDMPDGKLVTVPGPLLAHMKKDIDHVEAIRGDLVDMEGFFYAKAAFEAHVPYMSIRVVSDLVRNSSGIDITVVDTLASVCTEIVSQWKKVLQEK